MRKMKGLLIFLLGLFLLVGCKKKVTLEIDKTLTLQVEQEVKLTVNQVAKDLEFSGMGDVIKIRTSGDNVYIKGLKAGTIDVKVTYKPNKKITATVKVTVNPKEGTDDPQVEEYTLNFSVSVPESFTGDVYVLGGFNDWTLTKALKLTKGTDGKYKGSTTFETDATKLEYKYFNHNDWDYGEGSETGGYRGNREVSLSETTLTFEDEILSWEKVYDGTQIKDPEEYTFTFNVTVPEETEGNVYVVGNFTNWLDEGATPLLLTKGEGNTYSGKVTYTTNKSLSYKYVNAKDLTSINYDYEEVIGANRELTLEALTTNDTVESWKGGGYKEGAEEKTYTLNFKVTVPFLLPEGYKVFVVGSFNDWNQETALELTANELIYTGQTTVTTKSSQLEYMVVTGETFSWNHKPLKEDNSEYGFGENIIHELVDGINSVEYVVFAWKDLTAEATEETYTLTFNVTVPEGTKGNVFVVGSFTNWLTDPATPLVLTKNTDGTFSGSVEYKTVASSVEYKYINAKDLASIGWDYVEQSGNRTLTLTAPTATDTVTGWENGGYKEDVAPEMVDVVVRLNTVPTTTENNPIKLIGSMTDWNATKSLVFEKVGDVYEVTLNVDKNAVNQFKLYLDKGQETWHDHQASPDGTNELDNYTISIDEYTALLVEIDISHWKGLNPVVEPELVEVIVRLNSVPTTTENNPIKLIGSMNGWNTTTALVFEKVGEVYEATLIVDKNQTNEFKLYLDKGQETWHDHQASPDGTSDSENHVISDAEYTALLIEIDVLNWKGLTAPAPEVEYTLSFTVTVPEGTEGNVYVAGSFTNWTLEDSNPLLLTKGESNTYSGSVKYTTSATTLEYKYINSKDLTTNIYYEVLDNRVLNLTTPTANDTVTSWHEGGYKEPVVPEMVDVVVRLNSVPETTETFPIKLIGNMTNNWSVADAVTFELVGEVYEATITVNKNEVNEFKVYLDKGQETWHDHQASPDGIEEYGNRVIQEGEYTALLVKMGISQWKGLIPPAPEVEYTLKFSFNINVYVPEGYKIFLIGDFNNWDQTTPVELVGEAGLYTYQTTYTTDKTKLEYMILTGETFTWNHKTLKPDSSEYGLMENIVHDLVVGENAISYIVPGWAGIIEPEYIDIVIRLTSTPEIAGDYPIKLIGSMTDWNQTESLTFVKNGDYFDLTLTVNKNVENKFAVYLDKGQDVWHDHQAASSGVALPDHIITGEEYELLLVVINVPEWKGIEPPLPLYFMSGNPSENDPFNPNFTGRNKEERQALQRQVEMEYNVRINYIPYPAHAPWGNGRINAIINAAEGGTPLADVYYHISSDWIPQLVNGNAIGAVDEFLVAGAYGEKVPQNIRDATRYENNIYGFSTGGLGLGSGFYYNADLVTSLGLNNPTQMYLDGNWNWTTFKAWALEARALLPEGKSVLGGHVFVYAENLVPLNGGDFVDETLGKIVFNSDAAMETYAYIKELYDAGLFEAEPAYDAGSADWKTGKVIFHPGHFWFINADNRWGGTNINFELGFVPFPMSDEYKNSGKPYKSPIYGPSVPVMASGMTKERKELVFKVWWDLQRKVPAEQELLEYKAILRESFNKDLYVDAYLTVNDAGYKTIINGLGINRWSPNAYLPTINKGIKEGTYTTLLSEIQPTYQKALENYLGIEMVDVVIRLINIPETTGSTPIKLIGSMTGWNQTESLTFIKNGDYYEVTLNIDRNVENKFAIYLDKGQDVWHDHQASNDKIDAIPDRIITNTEYDASLVVVDIPEWKGIYYPEPEIVDVVVRLTSIPETTGEHPIKLIGSMTGWNQTESLTFIKNGEYYEVTLNIDRNVENKFAIYLDKGQDVWHDHQASSDRVEPIADHIISNSEYDNLLVLFEIPEWKGIEPPIELYFMSGNPSENDPFDPNFTGRNKEERQALQRQVEEEYNVKINYVPYPAHASWGNDRINAIINAAEGGTPLADVYYHVSSNWIPQLVNGGAIGAVDEFLVTGAYGEEVPQSVRDAGRYKGSVYTFSNNELGLQLGIYYNADLVTSLGLNNPTQMYLDGNWNWTTFKAWALEARALLPEGKSVLGGHVGIYSENLVPLNGGDYINDNKIIFNNQNALETYAYVKELYDAGLFEASPAYDAGSVDWKMGKVIFHPGHFWFINADNRWGGTNINFELGFVPFPMSDTYEAAGGIYRSPVHGASLPVMADGMTKERKELVFKVWWDLQRKVSAEQELLEYKAILRESFNKDLYVDAYVIVSGTGYNTVIDDLGINRNASGSYLEALNIGIKAGTYTTLLADIKPTYQSALENYLGLEMVDIVVRLTNIPLSTGTDPIKLIGSMTNNWTVDDALIFTKNGDVYEITLTVDKNVENKFALYLEKGQEIWHDHQASNDGSDVMADHIISADEYTALLVEINIPEWKGITPLVEYTLTFTVTVPEGTEGNVYVVGDFTNWLLEPNTPLQLTKGEGNKYSGSVKYTTSTETVHYKYINAKDLTSINYDYEEVIGENRVLTLTTPTATDTVESWKSSGYFEPANASVTFDITAPIEASVVCVVGPFNDWGEAENTLDWQLTKSGEKYTLTKDFLVSERNYSLSYKFVVNGKWENYSGDRSTLLEKNTSKTITETITISEYDAPLTTLPKHTLTFNVTVPEGTEGNVFVAGSFTNWLDTPCTPVQLTKGESNTYTATVEIRTLAETVEYKYVNAKDLASISWTYGENSGNRTLTLTTPTTNDIVTGWNNGGYKE